MALPFLDRTAHQKRQVVAVDLGSRITKAVHLQRRSEGFALCHYTLLDAPIHDKSLSPDSLAEHLKALVEAMVGGTKRLALAVGTSDAFVRHVEMPRMAIEAVRVALKHSGKNYLQQELHNYALDVHTIYEAIPQTPAGAAKNAPPAGHKQRVLVTGAKEQFVADYAEGAKRAGLMLDHLSPSLIGPLNAFELAHPESYAKEIVALVDVGFLASSICILQQGELVLIREVGIGADRLTATLAETMGISYGEAESIKIGMPGEVQGALEPVISSLARELRASIDFYEHQQDKAVTQVFLGGGTARSELVVQILQSELLAQCRTWNPAQPLQLALPPEQAAGLEQAAPQLAVAIGAALAAL
jgi:type IV pilus assembly protein PilM